MSLEPEKNNSLKAKLDIGHHIMLYPRVSTPEQMKNVSAEMQ
jgi:2-keto-3-deoxy-L-rhamnonate aldolase RhmA